MKTSITEVLKTLLRRNLKKLRVEIESYTKEENLWRTTDHIDNSAGNLCLHLVGNLNTYIGAEFGKTGYIRQREQEFFLKNTPRATLLSMIDETISVVENSLDVLTTNDLQKEYPRLLSGEKPSTELFLVHVTTHLTYHLGQINYHRRLLDR